MFPIYRDLLEDLKKHINEHPTEFVKKDDIDHFMGELAYRNFEQVGLLLSLFWNIINNRSNNNNKLIHN